MASSLIGYSAEITITPSVFTGSSTSYETTPVTASADGFDFVFNQFYKNGQMRVAKTGEDGFNLYNKTPIPGIKKIVVTSDIAEIGTWAMKLSDEEAVTDSAADDDIAGATSSDKTSVTFTVPSGQDASYFHINLTGTGKNAVKFKSIVITYGDDNPPPTPSESTKTDYLNRSNTYATDKSTGTGYKNISGISLNSDAVYYLNCAGDNSSIQLRDTSPAGIVTSKSGGIVKSIKIKINDKTTAGRDIEIYAKHTAYEKSDDLHSNDTRGELITTLQYTSNSGTELSYTFEEDYEYFGIKIKKSAAYLEEVAIEWETSDDGDEDDDPGKVEVPSLPVVSYNGEQLTGESITLEAGAKASLDITCANAAKIVVERDNEMVLEEPGNSCTYEVTEPCTLTIYGINSEGKEGDKFTYTFKYNEPFNPGDGTVWELVTDVNQIDEESEYILVAKVGEDYLAMSTTSSSSRFDPTKVKSDGQIVSTTDEPVLVLRAELLKEDDAGLYKWYNENKYLNSGSSTYLILSANPNDNSSKSKVAIEDNFAKISFLRDESRYIQTHETSNQFGYYAPNDKYPIPSLYGRSLELGGLVIKVNGQETQIDDDGEITLSIGDVITITAENANSISATLDEAPIGTFANGTFTWKVDNFYDAIFEVSATLGKQNASKEFMIEVTKPTISVAVNGQEVKVEDGDPISVVLGSELVFTTDFATNLVLSVDDEDVELPQFNEGQLAWKPTKLYEEEPILVEAYVGELQPVSLALDLTVTEPQITLEGYYISGGKEIPVTDDEVVEVVIGTTFTFTATNASKIIVERLDMEESENDSEEVAQSEDGANTVSWTTDRITEGEGLVVKAYYNEEKYPDIYAEIDLYINVTAPEITITGSYNNGAEDFAVEEEKDIIVEKGTVFTFTATNATKLELSEGEKILAEADDNTLTWTADEITDSKKTLTISAWYDKDNYEYILETVIFHLEVTRKSFSMAFPAQKVPVYVGQTIQLAPRNRADFPEDIKYEITQGEQYVEKIVNTIDRFRGLSIGEATVQASWGGEGSDYFDGSATLTINVIEALEEVKINSYDTYKHVTASDIQSIDLDDDSNAPVLEVGAFYVIAVERPDGTPVAVSTVSNSNYLASTPVRYNAERELVPNEETMVFRLVKFGNDWGLMNQNGNMMFCNASTSNTNVRATNAYDYRAALNIDFDDNGYVLISFANNSDRVLCGYIGDDITFRGYLPENWNRNLPAKLYKRVVYEGENPGLGFRYSKVVGKEDVGFVGQAAYHVSKGKITYHVEPASAAENLKIDPNTGMLLLKEDGTPEACETGNYQIVASIEESTPYAKADKMYEVEILDKKTAILKADDATFDFTKPSSFKPQVYISPVTGNGTALQGTPLTSTIVTLTTTNGGASPSLYKYAENGEEKTQLRVYKADTQTPDAKPGIFTLSVPHGYYINKVDFKFSATNTSPASLRCDNGEEYSFSADNTSTTFNIENKREVVFTVTDNIFIDNIKVEVGPKTTGNYTPIISFDTKERLVNAFVGEKILIPALVKGNDDDRFNEVEYSLDDPDNEDFTYSVFSDGSDNYITVDEPGVYTLRATMAGSETQTSCMAIARLNVFPTLTVVPADETKHATEDERTNRYNITLVHPDDPSNDNDDSYRVRIKKPEFEELLEKDPVKYSTLDVSKFKVSAYENNHGDHPKEDNGYVFTQDGHIEYFLSYAGEERFTHYAMVHVVFMPQTPTKTAVEGQKNTYRVTPSKDAELWYKTSNYNPSGARTMSISLEAEGWTKHQGGEYLEVSRPEGMSDDEIYIVNYISVKPVSLVEDFGEPLRSEEGIMGISANGLTGVEDVAVGYELPFEYYNLQGIRMNEPLAPGIYIRTDGRTASKVMIK